MAAPRHGEVAEMIRAAAQLAVEDVNNRFGHILQTQVSQAAAEEALQLVIAEATQKFDRDRERVDGVIAGANEEFQRQRSTLQNIVAEFQGSSNVLDQTVRQAHEETQTLKQEMVNMTGQHAKLREDLGTEFTSHTVLISKNREEMSAWAIEFKVSIMSML